MRTEDGHIIQQCLDGDHVAFGLLVDKYKRSVYAIAFSRLGNYHDAQDITQEVFIKAYQNLHTLRRWDNFMGWLYRITTNLCRDWLRIKARRLDKEYVEDQRTNKLDHISMESYGENMLYESINDSLESLPDIYREVLSLRYFGGMNIHEMSVFLGISTRTIDRRLREAMSKLKEETLTMMTAAKEQHELPGSFTFRILELIKHIRINPSPSLRMIPWGISMATGLIIAVIGFGMRFNITNMVDYAQILSSAGESGILDIEELPVEVVKVSDVTVISNQQLPGDGSDNEVPEPQNTLFMAPQAEVGTWTKKSDMPTARNALSTCVLNSKVYAIGGFAPPDAYLSTMEEYDRLTDKWTRKADMPTPRQNFYSCVVDGKIYALGGRNMHPDNGGALSAIEVYDPQKDVWTKRKDMPFTLEGFFTCVINGKVYVIGGFRDGEYFSSVEVYDPLTETWEKKTDMPTKRASVAGGVVNGKIYVIGGEAWIGPWNNGVAVTFHTVEEYDTVKDKWAQKADMPTSRRCGTAVVNGKIYAVGGNTWGPPQVIKLSNVEEYDPSIDTWNKKNDIPSSREGSVCSARGRIYLIGGNDGKKVLPTVEEYETGFGNKGIDLKGKLPTTWGDVRTAMNK